MTEFTEAISKHVRNGIAAQEAADRAAGRMTAAELDYEAMIEERRRSLGDELATAITGARRAGHALAELMGPLCDVEYEGERGSDIAMLIETARRALTAAQAQLVH